MAGGSGWQALQTSLHTALDAFGDLPDSSSPPHSIAQLRRFISHAEGSGSKAAELAPLPVLQVMAAQTLNLLEARACATVRTELGWLQSQHQGVVAADSPGWMRLPSALRATLLARFGAGAQESLLHFHCEARRLLADDAAAAPPGALPLVLGHLMNQCKLWRQVLDTPFGLGCPASASSPDRKRAVVIYTPLTVAPAANAPGLGPNALGEDAVTSEVCVELRSGPSGAAASPLIDEGAHWHVRVHVESRGSACRIQRLRLREDILARWPDAADSAGLCAAELAMLERIATVEHEYVPPVALHGAHSMLSASLKLPRLSFGHVLEMEPPVLRLYIDQQLTALDLGAEVEMG